MELDTALLRQIEKSILLDTVYDAVSYTHLSSTIAP